MPEEIYSTSRDVKVTRTEGQFGEGIYTVSIGDTTIYQYSDYYDDNAEMKAKCLAQGYTMCLQDFTDQIDI